MKFTSKAAEKRFKDSVSFLLPRVRMQIADFKNTYLEGAGNFAMKQIQNQLNECNEEIALRETDPTVRYRTTKEQFQLEECQEKLANLSDNAARWVRGPLQDKINNLTGIKSDLSMQYVHGMQKRLLAQIKRESTIRFEAMVPANEDFNKKSEKMVHKLVEYGIDIRKFTMERVSNAGDQFEFLFSDETIEVHARIIYVNGSIKAPHFRFITTSRSKK